MPIYTIQQRIKTLAENAVGIAGGEPAFHAEDIQFTHWNFNHRDGWLIRAWLAEYRVEAESAKHAYFEFSERLYRVIPRISLISQSYIQYMTQPYLIKRGDFDTAYLYYTFNVGAVGLMFQEDEKKALDLLLANMDVKDEFFLYWNDAVNATGYSSKLLIMFAALDALIKRSDGTKDYSMRVTILGQDLKDKIYHRETGLRNRLVHGEYFSSSDEEDYMQMIHMKVIKYFNDVLFAQKLITEDVVGPQRHFFDNDNLIRCWIKKSEDLWPLELKKVVEDCESNEDSHLPAHYRLVHDANLNRYF